MGAPIAVAAKALGHEALGVMQQIAKAFSAPGTGALAGASVGAVKGAAFAGPDESMIGSAFRGAAWGAALGAGVGFAGKSMWGAGMAKPGFRGLFTSVKSGQTTLLSRAEAALRKEYGNLGFATLRSNIPVS